MQAYIFGRWQFFHRGFRRRANEIQRNQKFTREEGRNYDGKRFRGVSYWRREIKWIRSSTYETIRTVVQWEIALTPPASGSFCGKCIFRAEWTHCISSWPFERGREKPGEKWRSFSRRANDYGWDQVQHVFAKFDAWVSNTDNKSTCNAFISYESMWHAVYIWSSPMYTLYTMSSFCNI